MRELCIAGRGSRLAMAQNELVKKLLEKEGYRVRILTVSTQGDRDRKSSVTALGGNGPFVRDVEKALLLGEADIAVHCVKDLPYEMAPGLCIAGMPDAADPRDCLILRKGAGKPVLASSDTSEVVVTPVAADTSEVVVTGKKLTIGTGSPRRTSQLRALGEQWGAEFAFKDIRGNITTRIEKLRRGDYDAIILARAGIDRIHYDLSDYEVRHFTAAEMVPSCCQGILAVECREADKEICEVLAKISDEKTRQRFDIERTLFRSMQADCSVAAAVHAQIGGSDSAGEAADGNASLTLYALLDNKESLQKGTLSEAPALIDAALKDLGITE